ncbi:MAG: hypoxanthine phosphoribosyltransferase [Chloroflexi bacterium]|nr:hypoxanthine phosphoribosyltransferase [Chloroflexota bacterium]
MLLNPEHFENIPPVAEILYQHGDIQARVRELGEAISDQYRSQGELLLVCILKGGVLFLTDLMREISIPHVIGFMAVSSYGSGVRASSGDVRIDMDLDINIRDKHVLIVEDIIDSGHTLTYILNQLETRQPASLNICCLLSKPARREVEIPIKFLGFEIEDKFVFGYGLDLDEKFRNLPFIAVFDLDNDH